MWGLEGWADSVCLRPCVCKTNSPLSLLGRRGISFTPTWRVDSSGRAEGGHESLGFSQPSWQCQPDLSSFLDNMPTADSATGQGCQGWWDKGR